MEVYVAPEVADVIALHPYLRDPAFRAAKVRDQIGQQANTLLAGHAAGDHRIRMHIMSWWPGARGKSLDDVLNDPFTLADAKLTMAREYGFQQWDDIGDLHSSLAFERTLDDMLAGDTDAFSRRLTDDPALITQRAVYGHGATLLHYIGANGVESHRQVTPANADTLATLLINAGADPHSAANMYGGGQTPFDLASTSAHPHHAGIAERLNTVLETRIVSC